MSESETTGEIIQRRARLTTWFAGVLACVTGFATLFRPFVSDVGAAFTLAGIANTCLFAATWWLLKSGRMERHAPAVLMTLTTLAALPLVLLSGGPNSQFASVLPLFPICAVMLGGRRLALIVTGFWICLLPLMFLLAPLLPDITGEPYHAAKASSRTLWVVLACAVSAAFALHFDAISRRYEQRLRDMAERDPLTGVGNRRALGLALTRSLAFARRKGGWVTVVLLDLDHFKRFNDSRGHAEGDIALARVADTLASQCRAGQDAVARFGGEEFALVLSQTDAEAARFAVEKIRNAVRGLALRYDDDSPDVLTATLGYVSVPGDEAPSHDQLLRRADDALYAGKHLGRDRSINADDLPAGLQNLGAATRDQRSMPRATGAGPD